MSFRDCVSTRGRTTVFLLAVFLHWAHWSAWQCHAQQEPAWKHLVLFSEEDLVVRLHFQESATLADTHWLRFEFENRGDQAIEINSVSYMFNREALDPESGEKLVSGGMGRGTARQLFPDESTGSISIRPEGRKSSEHVSNYASALLGLPPAKGHRVKVSVAVRIELKDGRRFEKRITDGVEFQFLWRYPSADDIASMQRRLRKLLQDPNNRYSTGYLIGAYLKVPDVANSVSVKDLVASLIPRADLPFSGRDSILRYLNDQHHDAPDLLAHVAKQLRAGDSVFIRSHMHHLPNVWHVDFTDPLVAAFEKHRYSREMILGHLARHALVQDDNQELARRLSDVYFREGDVKRLQEQQTDNPTSLLKSLGMTRDRRLVTVLAPFLRDRRKVKANMLAYRLYAGGPQAAPRVCDVATDAILVILDGKAKHLNLGVDPEKILKQRDTRIQELEKRLASLPEFANAVPPEPMVPLDKKARSISDRWKAEQKYGDLVQLMPVVKSGLTAEQVRQVLGLPIEIERSEKGERWLYLKPAFRQGVGDFHWLRLDAKKQVIDWEVLAWNGMYKPESAPPVLRRRAQKSKRQDDLWDDVFIIDALPDVLTRRGTELFSVSSTGRIRKSLGKFDRLRDAKIVTDKQVGDRIWLFCESPHRFPFAIDLASGECVDFAIDGLEIPGDHTPSIQSHVSTPFETAVLMVAGGDRATWPRPGNRPIYFWINLRTGDSRRFPTGWDLDYFSADQKTAVFSAGAGRRIPTAIDVADGQSTTMVDRKESNHVPFDWSNKDTVKPLLDSEYRLVGLSARGKAFALEIVLNEPYIPSAKILGDRVALHVRGYGSPRSNGNLWVANLVANGRPKHVSSGVWDYQILDDKRCAFTMPVLDPRRNQIEAFVYDASRDSMWNVLDGVEGLREGTSRVHFFAEIGESTKSRVLVSISCTSNADYRESWRRWVLLTSDGKRYLIDDMPDEVYEYAQGKFWLLESGNLLLAVGQQVSVEGRDVTHYRVHHVTFK